MWTSTCHEGYKSLGGKVMPTKKQKLTLLGVCTVYLLYKTTNEMN